MRLTDQQFVDHFFSLFRRLDTQRDWISYDQWNDEKEQMIERMKSIIGDLEGTRDALR